uniref:Uncharacterized protein n=1 Tax=Tanacetum cinerariifolium TaxID=118510 RepID=A0A6L2LVS4_TANCI|nr:hypothetical protein [Tanacetum cinerariifolium]
MLPIELTNDEIRNTKAYKEYYAFATGESVPKPKASARRKRSGSDSSTTPLTAVATPRPTIAATPKLTAAAKGKQPAKATKAKSLSALSEPGGSGTDEGTGSKPGVLDVPSDDSEEDLSWNSLDDEDADAQEKEKDDDEGDERDESDDGEEDDAKDKDGDEKDDGDEEHEIAKTDKQDDTESGRDDDEDSKSDEVDDSKETKGDESFDLIPRTPKESEDDGNNEEEHGLNTVSQEIEDSHVTLTLVNPDGQQESSAVSSQFVSSMLNPISDAGMESIFATSSTSMASLPTSTPTQMTEAVRVAVQLQTNQLRDASHRENDEFLRIVDENMKKIIKEQVKSQVKDQVSRILPRIEQDGAEENLIKKMEGNKSIQRSDEQRNLYKVLVEAYEADKIILDTYGDRVILKRRRDDEDDQGMSTTGSKSRQASANETTFAEEPMQTTSQIEEPSHSPKKPQTPDRDWNKALPAAQRRTQTWISELAKQAYSHSSFNELLDTPLDFSNFIMNRLRVDTLTPELLARPTYELMKGSCKSLTELEYHLEEVYKATTDQLDWVKPKGQQYPHNMLQPLPLIPDNRGRRVIPFEHFINNDLDYLWGGKLSNLTVEEHFAFNVSLRMFTRSIVIQRRVKDLQLGVESYQKRLNLTKPGTYRSDLKRREAYTAYSNPRGFIYQNKDKKNRLMRIDELHKFSDETLNDVRTALDDRLKGIRMLYLPYTIWRKYDKDRAAAMIQAIDKMLKTMRIMRSLENFVGGRLYERDFQMLQRTI